MNLKKRPPKEWNKIFLKKVGRPVKKFPAFYRISAKLCPLFNGSYHTHEAYHCRIISRLQHVNDCTSYNSKQLIPLI